MSAMRSANTVLACSLLLAAAGCGGPDRAAITGQVTLDGQPVDGGSIRFLPLEGPGTLAASAPIEGGKYSIPASSGPGIGPCRVEIRWLRPTGRQVEARGLPQPGATMEEKREAVPARYNTASELTAHAKSGRNTFDFALTSK